MDYTPFVGHNVRIEITNPGKENGFFGAVVTANNTNDLTVQCSKGGHPTTLTIEKSRIVTIVLT